MVEPAVLSVALAGQEGEVMRLAAAVQPLDIGREVELLKR
jgi:hypothetical protein